MDTSLAVARLALLLVICTHVLIAPFTKVEESFTLQAAHDMLYHGAHLDAYDHHEFPGAVPRSFMGAAALATVAAPAVATAHVLGASKFASLLLVRCTMGIVAWLAFLRLSAAVHSTLGRRVAIALCVVTSCQFHIAFYASRTLPNSLAAIPVTLALAHWLDGTETWLVVVLLTATTAIVRCDMLLVTAAVCMHMLLTRRVPFVRLVLLGLGTAAAAVATSVLVDSFFWGRWIWPEAEVFYFNAVLGKSAEWGVAPCYWYFTSALPRGLLGALPLAAVGAWLERRARSPVLVGGAVVAAFSCLGHKELRFVLPVLPLFNVAAACGLVRLLANARKGVRGIAAALAAAGLVAATMVATALLALAAHHNYPGGRALMWLQSHVASQEHVSVHMDTLSCMTGVSRFVQTQRRWRYDKVENVSDEYMAQQRFTYRLSEEEHIHGFTAIHVEDGFAGYRWIGSDPLSLNPLQPKLTPAVYVHRRLPDASEERP